jgi:type IV pilus secretin PilQ/predicted competence protein
MVKVGRMKNKLLLFLAGCAVSFGLACASHSAGPAVKLPAIEPAAAANQVTDGARLTALKAELTPQPRLLLRTEGHPAFVSYSPQPDVFVLDFAKTAKQPDLVIPTNLPPFIASVAADEAIEQDQHLTRVTLRFTEPTTARTISEGDGVAITFESLHAAGALEPLLPLSAVVTTEQLTGQEPPVAVAVLPEDLADAKPATILRGIQTTGSGMSLRILLDANGKVEYKAFRLTNPLRVVLDLQGLRNRVKSSAINLGDPLVKRIRVAQFQTAPIPVTRVVLDLDEIVDYRVEARSEGLGIAFGDAPVESEVAVATAPAAPPPVPERMPEPVVAMAPTAADPEPAPQVPPPATTPSPTMTYMERAQIAPPPAEDVFVEPQAQMPTITGGIVQPGGQRQISPTDRIFTGEPISLNLKDADIKDVLRLFAQLTGLNMAIDPNVSGTVTVQFENVPWDQALDLILRQNNLTYVLQGNVMRVGTIDRLAQEQVQTRRLEEEERLNVPLQTIIRRLSYAQAANVQALARDLASPRGRIIVDPRTNQLIITDVPQYIPVILSLIENVDIPTPQVVIEARIVTTSKTFAQDFGIRWGFSGVADPALGTGTGLAFPNRIAFTGGPFDFSRGADLISLTLSDVLGTFDLDLALTAAETEGLARIISAPKITTQDNQAAEIQQGVQVPVQTRVNFTTTTTFVDAVLRLEVTPQITAADTVIMQINLSRTEIGAFPEGAPAPQLNTRRATTRLMVRDGGTAVIGGIYDASERRDESRVPFLHQIPVLGNLFKSKGFSTEHNELLIFITPRIVRGT